MNFSEYARRLYSVVGEGCGTALFSRSLLESLVLDEARSILDEYSDTSYKSYFNGRQSVSRLARRLMPFIDETLLYDYFEPFADGAVQVLCSSFQDVLPEIDPMNAPEQLSALLVQILREAAEPTGAQKRSRPVDSAAPDRAAVQETKTPGILCGAPDQAALLKQTEDYLGLMEKLFFHRQDIVENPLLLPLLLMTFSSYLQDPEKMHRFYTQAVTILATRYNAV